MAQTTIEVRLILLQREKNKLDIVDDLAVNNGGTTYYLTLISYKIRKEMVTYNFLFTNLTMNRVFKCKYYGELF